MKRTDYGISANLVKGNTVERGCYLYNSFLFLCIKLPEILED